MEPSAHILAVDDDPLTCRLLQFLLTSQGSYEVDVANEPVSALAQIEARVPDLVLLDLQLPRIDGFAVMRRLKLEHPDLPVIMLTARAEMQDRLAGLEAGADDYVVKPFEPAELLARVRAVLRRTHRLKQRATGGVIVENGVQFEVDNLTVVTVAGVVVSLTPTEGRILHKLMANPNHVVSRSDLTSYAVGYGADTSNNHIDVYIGRLRRKLGDNQGEPRYIATVRGSGYKFLAPNRIMGIRTGRQL